MLQHAVDFRRLHVLAHLINVNTGIFGQLIDLCFVKHTTAFHEGRVDFHVFALLGSGQCGTCRNGTFFAQDREFNKHGADFAVGIFRKFLHTVKGAFAITAVIIKKFDHGNRCIKRANRWHGAVSHQRIPDRLNGFGLLTGLFGCLPDLNILDGAQQNIRVFHQILLDHAFDLGLLRVAKVCCLCRDPHGKTQRKHNGGTAQKAFDHMRIHRKSLVVFVPDVSDIAQDLISLDH